MSRIGRAPIALPKGVSFEQNDGVVNVKGPKGALSVAIHPEMSIVQEEGHLVVTRPSDSTRHKSLHGLTRALVNNAVVGVGEGFAKVLELRGVGYRAEVAGKNLNLTLGFSHPVQMPLPEGLTAETVPSTPTMENGYLASTITLRSHDKQVLGDFAADVRAWRPVEPYKGKGLRYKGEVVKRKQGKADSKKK